MNAVFSITGALVILALAFFPWCYGVLFIAALLGWVPKEWITEQFNKIQPTDEVTK